MAREKWTRDQSILALYLYCQIPFGQIHAKNKHIIETAEIIRRSPSALSMKMCNFARFDPELQSRGVSGLSNGSRLDWEIWSEFSSDFSQLAYESTVLLSKFENRGMDSFVDLSDLPTIPLGDTRDQMIRTRINQTFFREALLSSYHYTCCITKIQISGLLVASHIKPWSICNQSEKTNPRNGLLLNAFHDRAFDKGYISISKDLKLIVSEKVDKYANNEFSREWLKSLNGLEINRPEKFLPAPEFIEYHNDAVFIG